MFVLSWKMRLALASSSCPFLACNTNGPSTRILTHTNAINIWVAGVDVFWISLPFAKFHTYHSVIGRCNFWMVAFNFFSTHSVATALLSGDCFLLDSVVSVEEVKWFHYRFVCVCVCVRAAILFSCVKLPQMWVQCTLCILQKHKVQFWICIGTWEIYKSKCCWYFPRCSFNPLACVSHHRTYPCAFFFCFFIYSIITNSIFPLTSIHSFAILLLVCIKTSMLLEYSRRNNILGKYLGCTIYQVQWVYCISIQ